MSDDRLTDERVSEYANESRWVLGFVQGDAAKLAREVQEYRALRPDCPTCHSYGAWLACPDCTDGKMPLDKWVALLVENAERLSAMLRRGTFSEIDDAQVKHETVLQMVPK